MAWERALVRAIQNEDGECDDQYDGAGPSKSGERRLRTLLKRGEWWPHENQDVMQSTEDAVSLSLLRRHARQLSSSA